MSSWFAGAVRIAIAFLNIGHALPVWTVTVIGIVIYASIRIFGRASNKDKGDE